MNLKDYTDQNTQVALAKAISASTSFVNQWVSGKRPIPAPYCVAIEQATKGQVTRQEMRKDWQSIWPELAKRSKKQVSEV